MPFPRCFSLATLAVLLVPGPLAHGQAADPAHKKDWERCFGADASAAIKACKAILEEHLEPPAQLALVYNARAVAYMVKEQPDLALADFAEAIRLRPGFSAALANRGNLHAGRHEYDLAIADYTDALRLTPQPAPGFSPDKTLSNRGVVYNAQGDYVHALEDFSTVLLHTPSDAQALFHRGNVYSNQGDYAHALADYERSLALSPGAAAVTEARDRAAARVALVSGAAVRTAAALAICPVPATQPPNYLDDEVGHLKKIIPDLHGLSPENNDPEQMNSILNQTSAAIASMMPKIPNLVAREEITLTIEGDTSADVSVPGRGGRGALGGGGRYPLGGNRTRESVYTYRIVHRNDPPGTSDLDEFRTDIKNRPLPAQDAASRSIGFGALWMLFAPANLREAHFRYLGRQKIAGHETFVFAFTQIPGGTRLGTEVGSAKMRCTTYIQGIVWVDQEKYHIVHMQTDLLSPLPAIDLTQLRSILRYNEVKIPERALSLWLPTNIAISWREGPQSESEEHRYSRYRLYSGTARLLTTVEGSEP